MSSEFSPFHLIDDEVKVPYFLQKEKTGKYGKLEKGVNWSPYTLSYFEKENIFQIIDKIISYRKPIYTGIFGDTGNGKTSIIILLLQYLYRKYSPTVEVTPQTFHHFYWIGHSVTLDPIIVSQYFREQLKIPKDVDVFLVIEEAEGVVGSDRGNSIQNADARYAMDTLRANKIHILFVAINLNDLDRRIREGRLILRIEAIFNDIPKQKVKYNVLIWAKGYYFKNREYTDRMGYVVFAEDQWIPWCDYDFHKVADDLKEGKVFGDDISAFISSNENKKYKLNKLRELSEDDITKEIVDQFQKEYPDLSYAKGEKNDTINIVIDELLVPLIQVFEEKEIGITDGKLEGIIRSCENLPRTGVYWRPYLQTAKRLAHTHNAN